MKKIKRIFYLGLFLVAFGMISYSQTVESEGFLVIQYIQPQGSKTVINIVSPNGASEQMELEKLPIMSFSTENIKRILSANQARLLGVLESYRKKDYEVVSVTSEIQGYVTNYLLRRK